MCTDGKLVKSQHHILLIALLVYVNFSCAITKPSGTSSAIEEYSEDLTAFRPELDAVESLLFDIPEANVHFDTISYEVSEKLNIVLDSAASYARSTINYIDGFTIQVYGGDNRTAARNFRTDLIRNFPETRPKMVFEQPNYKVRVGSYYTRLEAQGFFLEVTEFFPKAILVPTRLKIQALSDN